MRSTYYDCVRLGLLAAALCLGLTAEADLASLFTNLNAHPLVSRPRLPSILVIECDSVGFLDLSCYGQKQFGTPNLDRLAAQGMLFTNFDANNADSPSARATLMLGKEMSPAPATMPAEARTVAQILRADGYHTGLIGEWNFGGRGSGSAPWERGFDEFAGYFSAAEAEDYYADFMWRYSPRSILNTNNNQWDTYIGQETLLPNLGNNHGEYIPDLYTKAALNFLKINQPSAANHYRPFFLWLNYPLPRANHSELARSGNGLQVPTDAPYSDNPWPQAEKNKAAMIARLDGYVGQILDLLATHAMTNNVAVFFSSATVPRKEAGVDPTFFPSVVSTNDARLPMIAWWPRHIPAGRVSAQHWTPANFMATAAEIAMADYPTNDVAPSILPALYGRTLTNAPAQH